METQFYLLDADQPSRVVKIMQLIFGIFCIGIAIFWAIFNFRSGKANTGIWTSIIFLTGFGAYQVLSGLGRTAKYIEIKSETISLKQTSVLPQIEIKAADIEMVEMFPLSINFILKDKKKIILRFGLNNTEIIDPVKNSLGEFTALNNISYEKKAEKL